MIWKCPDCGIEKIGDPEAVMAICTACQVVMLKEEVIDVIRR